MRASSAIWLVFVLSFGVALMAAGAKEAQAPPAGDPFAAIDQLAQQVFNEADHNHNHVLNKTEFRNAYTLLETQVDELGRSGAIGKPRKNRPDKDKDKGTHTAASVTASADKLARSNKVSQAEFTFFVHAFVEQADETWRELHAATDAQRKAYNAQRRAMGVYRGRPRYVFPY
jgi:hypothetical protein